MPVTNMLEVRFARGNDTPPWDVFDNSQSDICIYKYEGVSVDLGTEFSCCLYMIFSRSRTLSDRKFCCEYLELIRDLPIQAMD